MSHRVLGEQLAMFMTKDEVGELTSGDYFPYKVHEVEHRIVGDTRRGTQYLGEMGDSIRAQGGVSKPLAVLRNDHLMNGHHRWTAAPAGSLFPVIHGENMEPLMKESWEREDGRGV